MYFLRGNFHVFGDKKHDNFDDYRDVFVCSVRCRNNDKFDHFRKGRGKEKERTKGNN